MKDPLAAWTEADADRICEALRDATTISEAAPGLGLSPRQVARCLQRFGRRARDYLGTGPPTVRSAQGPAAGWRTTRPCDTTGLDGVRQYATAGQQAAIDALLAHGSVAAAAASLGYNANTLREHLREAKRRAARAGWSPAHDMTRTVPDGFHVRGVSTLYGSDGTVRGQWVKSNKDQEHQVAALLDAVQGIAEPFRGLSAAPSAPAHTDEDLLTIYPMGDPHLGMFAWGEETGADFDLEIAERNLVAAVDHLVSLSPPSAQALVVNLGDFFHTDTASNRTERAGHALDVDTRWAKMLRVGVRAMRRIIDQALTKHEIVRVINEIGNHDRHAAQMLSLCLAMYYENDPRVQIDTSPSPFHWLRFGACLVGVTHGHECKAEMLPGIMATDRARDWGETLHRYWYTGHVHHDRLREFAGCTVESFRTLAPRDAWAHAAGYRSRQDMKCDVLHREHGRVNRHIVGIEQVAA